MYVPDDLLAFIRTHRDELTLSVYIASPPADPAARRDWRVRLRQRLQDVRGTLDDAPLDERDAFERCAAEALGRLPQGETGADTHGWACFASAGGDTFATGLHEPTEATVAWGPGAQVVPYLQHQTEGRALVVRVDGDRATIARWYSGALEQLATFGPQAGERLLPEVRAAVAALGEAREPVLIGGTAAHGTRLLDLLPDVVAARAILVPGLTMQSPDPSALTVIQAALTWLDTTVRMRRMTELHELARTRGRAAVGYAPARAAADVGAIAELIFSVSAWRLHPTEIEDLVQRALFHGASVVVAPDFPVASPDRETEGIIAGLRFPLPLRS